LIDALDVHYNPSNRGSLSLAFVTDDRLARLHGEFCADPAHTDVITFPALEAESFGELCVSPQAALDYVKEHGGSPENELCRYVIHGYLHLLGYDDLQPKSKIKMRRQERIGLSLAKQIGKIFTFKYV
jgi:probable rRNA maturation factor